MSSISEMLGSVLGRIFKSPSWLIWEPEIEGHMLSVELKHLMAGVKVEVHWWLALVIVLHVITSLSSVSHNFRLPSSLSLQVSPFMPKWKKSLAHIQKTSFCPRCKMRFSSETCVLQHINQPSSACGTLLIDISDSSCHPSSQTVQRPKPLSQNIHNIRQLSPELANLIQMDLDGLPYVSDDPMDVDNTLHDNQP